MTAAPSPKHVGDCEWDLHASECPCQDAAAPNGWHFDPTREVWWKRTGPNSWTEVPGSLDNPPA